jgi:hypothetical protein
VKMLATMLYSKYLFALSGRVQFLKITWGRVFWKQRGLTWGNFFHILGIIMFIVLFH